jgi:uncharacterized protein (TIGR02271 family)
MPRARAERAAEHDEKKGRHRRACSGSGAGWKPRAVFVPKRERSPASAVLALHPTQAGAAKGGVRLVPDWWRSRPAIPLRKGSIALSGTTDHEPATIPLVHETLHVERRAVATDQVRVRTVTDEVAVSHTAEIEEGEIEIERLAVERPVDAVPAPYEEDGVWVVPVVAERLVVEKRLFVVEELRIRRRAVTRTVPVEDTVRQQRAVIERAPPSTGETNG